MKAAQHQRLLAASLAITRALLLLAVMLLWPENRVWAFAPAPHLASAETSHATPSSIRGNVPLAADPASGCCVAAETAAPTVPQIVLNKAAGDAYEAEVLNNVLPQTQTNIQPQITVLTNGPSGLKVRLDALGEDLTTGDIVLTDAKASPTAPLTPNQTIVYPELQTYGGTVVGQGKAPYVGGTPIPPTQVQIIRKP